MVKAIEMHSTTHLSDTQDGKAFQTILQKVINCNRLRFRLKPANLCISPKKLIFRYKMILHLLHDLPKKLMTTIIF